MQCGSSKHMKQFAIIKGIQLVDLILEREGGLMQRCTFEVKDNFDIHTPSDIFCCCYEVLLKFIYTNICIQYREIF